MESCSVITAAELLKPMQIQNFDSTCTGTCDFKTIAEKIAKQILIHVKKTLKFTIHVDIITYINVK